LLLSSIKARNQGLQLRSEVRDLVAHGKNIGDILIAEDLAQPFICGPTRCPKMPDWQAIIEEQLADSARR